MYVVYKVSTGFKYKLKHSKKEFDSEEKLRIEMKTKELLFTSLENIDKQKSSVIVNRMLNYNPSNPKKLTPVITISVVSSCLTLSITDNNKCNFSITSIEGGFVADLYNLEYEGLFKEVYNAIKHLLVIEV